MNDNNLIRLNLPLAFIKRIQRFSRFFGHHDNRVLLKLLRLRWYYLVSLLVFGLVDHPDLLGELLLLSLDL
jgi:hypothetical protein